MHDRSSLDALFRPRSVAVVGASRRAHALGTAVFRNILGHGFSGAVYPVNPTAAVIQSVRAYPTLEAIPDEVDLAVLVTPKDQILAIVDDCAAKGVKGLIVITAGFGETGASGRRAQEELVRRVRGYGMRMVGPNCLGLVNTDPSVRLNATFAPSWPPEGDVAFSSQSGALGVAILDRATEMGIGIRHFISVGNKADVSGNDLLEYWEKDDGVRLILLYLESLGNPRRFMQIAARVSRRKPIAVVKSGRTEAGKRAASSHTGSLAGLDIAVGAVLGQAGVMRTDSIGELFDLALLLTSQPVPRGGRVGILTNAGGPGIMASDACEHRGLEIPQLAAGTQEELRAVLPDEAAVGNPVDMIASASAGAYESCLRLVLADPAVDSVMILFVPPLGTEAAAVAEAIGRAAAGTDKPVVTCFMGTHGIPEALRSLREGRFPSYDFPEAAALALSRAVRYGRWLAREPGAVAELEDVSPEQARSAFSAAGTGGSEGRWLDPAEVGEVLAAYGIRTPRAAFASDVETAVRIARGIGFPVAVKLTSESLVHKTDVGGVELGLRDEDAVRAAFAGIEARLAEQGRQSEMAGVLVQDMVSPGVETFIGVTQDEKFGPLIGFGIGGVAVELWRDVVFRVHPITDVDARQMVEEIRGIRLLDGFRGAPPADREAIVDALQRVSRMVADLHEIRELDINPFLALVPGQGGVAVDARIRVAG